MAKVKKSSKTAAPTVKKNQAPLAEKTVRSIIYILLFLTPLAIKGHFFEDFVIIPKYAVSQPLILLALILLSLSLILGRTGFRSWFSAFHPVLLFFVLVLVSVVFSNEPGFSFRNLVPTFFLLFFALVCGTYLRKPSHAWTALFTILASSLINSVYGILQYHGIDFLDWEEFTAIKRVAGFVGNATWFGSLLISGVIISLAFTLSPPNFKYSRIMGICGLVIFPFAILLSGTRSAFVSIIIAAVILIRLLLLLNRSGEKERHGLGRKPVLITMTAILIVIALGIGISRTGPFKEKYGDVVSRIANVFSTRSDSVRLRLLSWYTASTMIRENPLLGIGWGGFRPEYAKYKIPILEDPKNSGFQEIVNLEQTRAFGHVHNEYLEIWAESGTPAFLAFLYICSWALFLARKKTFRPRQNDEDAPAEYPYLYTVFGLCLTGILVDSLFSFPLHLPANGLYFWCFAGILLGLKTENAPDTSIDTGRIPGLAAGITILILSLVFSYFGWLNLAASHKFAQGKAITGLARATENTKERIMYLNEAIAHYEDGLRHNPYHGSLVEYSGNAHNALSIELRKTGEFARAAAEENRAIEDLRRSISLINDIQIYLNLSSLYARKGDSVKAKEYAGTAVAIQPLYIKPHINLAKIALQLEDYNLARDSYVSALMSDPGKPDLYYELGNLYMNIFSDNEKALSFFNSFLKLAEPKDSRINEIKIVVYKLNDIKNMKIPDPKF